jgi:hypothetical protein
VYSLLFYPFYFNLECECESNEQQRYLNSIGTELRNLKRLTDRCESLIERTTSVDVVEENLLHDVLDFTKQLIDLTTTIKTNCSTRIETIVSTDLKTSDTRFFSESKRSGKVRK